MATILLTWELGGGMGHLLCLRAIGDALVERSHQVVYALRDLSRVNMFFDQSRASFLQAPVAHITRPPARLSGFVDVLANIGFSDPATLEALFVAWNRLFDQVGPDVVVTDCSPTALLALRGRPIRKVNVGQGLYIPADAFPLPHLSVGGQPVPYAQLVKDEQMLAAQVNSLLTTRKRPALARLSQIFHDVDETILATYSELDPYSPRTTGRYWGHWQGDRGAEPVWPDGSGPKVFAYLKPFSGMEQLLRQLVILGVPTVILAAGLNLEIQRRYSAPSIRYESTPLNTQKVVDACDLAITHGGHGMVASMLLGGKPSLWIPLFTEQLLNAQAAAKLGAGRWILPTAHGQIAASLCELLASKAYLHAAQGFARKYESLVPGSQIAEIVAHIEAWTSHR